MVHACGRAVVLACLLACLHERSVRYLSLIDSTGSHAIDGWSIALAVLSFELWKETCEWRERVSEDVLCFHGSFRTKEVSVL